MDPEFDLVFYRTKSFLRSERFRWQMQNRGNHEVVGASSEGYSNRQDCVTNANTVLDLGNRIDFFHMVYAW